MNEAPDKHTLRFGNGTDPDPKGSAQATPEDYQHALPQHYRIIRMIGKGGMAEVFLAEDDRLGRNVAIKFLNSEFRRDPERMKRFNQEARAASALNHPNILIIHDIGEREGFQFIVSEFVEGEALSSRISRGKVPLAEAVGIAIQIASALSVSHKAGIVHRDLKPDNIMIRHDGSVKILDFGLAKETGGVLSKSGKLDVTTINGIPTSPGLILGTPQYMSPEQARGKPLDGRTDVFSLGIIIFEMVAGRPPFTGESMADIIAAIIGKEPRRLEEYLHDPPVTLIRIVEKALRKDREQRYGTMEHLLSDLKDLRLELVDEPHRVHETDGTETRITAHNPIRTTIRTVFTGKLIPWQGAILLGVVLVAVLAVTAWWFFGNRKPPVVQGSMRTVPITSWNSGAGELVASASFSPNAKMIAFAATKTGSTEIWVKPTVGGEPIQVTKSGFYNQYPVWSPNEQDIAYFSKKGSDRGIWRASFAGGQQTQIASGVGPSARPLLWTKEGRIYFQENSELFSLDERTGEISRITNFESKGVRPRMIEVSSDASALAYTIKEGDLWKLKVAGIEGDTWDEIASSQTHMDHLAWHPDGRSVIFSRSIDGAFQVFRSGVSYPAPVQLSNGSLDFLVQDVASDGSSILYGSINESSDLWKVDVQDPKPTVVANDVPAEFWADISPDGKFVTYQSVDQAGGPFRGSVSVRPIALSAPPMQISNEGFSPLWSPNGLWIAYFRRSDSGISLWRARSTGGEAVKLADNVNAPGYMATPYLKVGTNHASWSPDSTALAFSDLIGGISSLRITSPDGSSNKLLAENVSGGESFCCPTWTADGRNLVFISEYRKGRAPPQGVYRLWSSAFDGSGQRIVFETSDAFRFLGLDNEGNPAIAQRANPSDGSAVSETTFVYSVSAQTGEKTKIQTLYNSYFDNIHLTRDGRYLAFVSRQDNVTALWTVPVKGSTPMRLLTENDPKILISSLTWSPDGKSIVFGKQTRTNLLSLLTR